MGHPIFPEADMFGDGEVSKFSSFRNCGDTLFLSKVLRTGSSQEPEVAAAWETGRFFYAFQQY
jgi:hypothetical protein